MAGDGLAIGATFALDDERATRLICLKLAVESRELASAADGSAAVGGLQVSADGVLQLAGRYAAFVLGAPDGAGSTAE